MNTYTVSKNISYTDLLDIVDVDILEFKVNWDSRFISSLIAAGYASIRYTHTPAFVSLWMQQRERALGECAPTSVANTGDIWVDNKECYYSIRLERDDDNNFEVQVARVPTRGTVVFIEDTE